VSEVVIRFARPPDLARLSAIEESGADTFARAGIPLADRAPPSPPDQWTPALDAGLLWVADDPHAGLVGFLAGKIEDGGLHIEEIDVMMERQKQGHGRRLMQRAIDGARDRGLAALTLTTFRSVAWNGPFYGSLGFVELSPAETPAWLAAILAKETARGFEDRCAMRLAL
jgi:GNAT superfamily N-acetyltransferase